MPLGREAQHGPSPPTAANIAQLVTLYINIFPAHYLGGAGDRRASVFERMAHGERRWALLASLLLAFTGNAAAILHEHLSFDPPFLDVDHFGKRTVGIGWDLNGETKALKNFARLTPDRQVSLYFVV